MFNAYFLLSVLHKHHFYNEKIIWVSLVVQTVKNLSAMREIRVRSLGWEDPLEREMATHSSIAWRIAMDRGAWQVTVQGSQRVGLDRTTNT